MITSDARSVGLNATDCDKEPIHIPGAIQSHGVLFVVRASDYTVLQVSQNISDILNIAAEDVLHQPLSQIFDLAPIRSAVSKLTEKHPRLLNPIPLKFEFRGRPYSFDGIIHRSGRNVVVELEPNRSVEPNADGFADFYERIRDASSDILESETLHTLFDSACRQIKQLTGFSRVLVYQFDENWDGTVIAEAKDESVDSLMNHRFPASDIPAQARALYASNWLRIIPNANYTPSKLVPVLNPLTDKPVDLSNAVLRSVSPIHVEYMKNMGFLASMSISLIRRKKLWGLISCHNIEPKFLTYSTRVACEYLGQNLSSQLDIRPLDEEPNYSALLKHLFGLTATLGPDIRLAVNSFKAEPQLLLSLANAHGVVIANGRHYWKVGATPADDEITKLRSVALETGEKLFYSTSIGTLLSRTKAANKVAGMLLVNLGQDLSIIWFRRELAEDVAWSGNPHEAKSVGDDGKIHPRRSFATWLEKVEGRAKAWSQGEVDAVSELAKFLDKFHQVSVRDHHGVEIPSEFRRELSRSIEKSDLKAANLPKGPVVTQTTTIQEASLDSASLFENFAELSVAFLDAEGLVRKWTAGAKRLLGYTSKQMIGRTIDLFFDERDVLNEKPRKTLDFVREHERCEEETWLYRADRSSFWGNLKFAAIRTESGTLLGFSVVIQDVTREKAAEEELKATKIAAEAANQAKSSFLANISHEIRTPLGAVLGFAELLSQPDLPEDERQSLFARVRRNGTQLTNLINDLLDLTKVEANRLEIESISFDLAILLNDIKETFALKALDQKVSFEILAKGPLPRIVVSDPTRLRQILVNLIGNALKFTPAGGSVRTVISKSQFGARTLIEFRVIDTGRGISEDQKPKLFQPFSQADSSTTRRFGGTGLGLFVSQRLARLLHGDVMIESSQLGKGTTFLAAIEVGLTDDDRTFNVVNSQAELSPVQTQVRELSEVKVLVVDDSPDNRHLIKTYLSKVGAEVEVAVNGREGVDKALAENYDVVLMDVQMPILDGNGAMRELKSRSYTKPVIALTAHAMTEEREHSSQFGFADYLTKPVDRQLLIETIRNLAAKSNPN